MFLGFFFLSVVLCWLSVSLVHNCLGGLTVMCSVDVADDNVKP